MRSKVCHLRSWWIFKDYTLHIWFTNIDNSTFECLELDLLWWTFYLHMSLTYVFQFDAVISFVVKLLQHVHVFVDLSWLSMTILSNKIQQVPVHLPILSIFAIVWYEDFEYSPIFIPLNPSNAQDWHDQ